MDLEVLSLRHTNKWLIKVRIIFMLDKTLFERINDQVLYPAELQAHINHNNFY